MTLERENRPDLGEPKTKLVVIRERLLANPDVHFRELPPSGGDQSYYYHDNYPTDFIVERVRIVVAPKKPTFSEQELHNFIGSLMRDLERDPLLEPKNEGATYWENGALILGPVEFEDLVGKFRKTTNTTTTISIIETSEPEKLKKAGVITNRESKKEDVQESNAFRRIQLMFYPNIVSADIAYKYQVGERNGTIDHSIRPLYLMAEGRLTPQLVRIFRAITRDNVTLEEVLDYLKKDSLASRVKGKIKGMLQGKKT